MTTTKTPIIITRDVPQMASDAWQQLLADGQRPQMFLRGEVLLEYTDHGGTPRFVSVSQPRFAHAVRRATCWNSSSGAKSDPPFAVLQDMYTEPRKPLDFLERICAAPVFVPPDSLLIKPGYYQQHRTYLLPSPELAGVGIPATPSDVDVQAAVDLICCELLGDFPFVADRDRAHAVSLFLLPFVRPLIDGPTPLHLIRKPMPGAGASLLTKCLLTPSMGTVMPMTEAKGNDEWRKRLTATLLTEPGYVWIDNLGDRLDSVALASLVSEGGSRDRILSSSDMAVLTAMCVWVATGNNPTLSTEMGRRTVPISLDPQVERPQDRADFRHPHLYRWTREHRRELVAAACTLVMKWIREGKPAAHGAAPLGTFEAWSEVIGGILDVVGVRGFLEGQAEFYDTHDDQGAAVRHLVELWKQNYGTRQVGAAELLPLANQILELDIPDKTQSSAVKLGKFLVKLDQTVYAGVRICDRGHRGNARQYQLVEVQGVNAQQTPAPQGGAEAQLRVLP